MDIAQVSRHGELHCYVGDCQDNSKWIVGSFGDNYYACAEHLEIVMDVMALPKAKASLTFKRLREKNVARCEVTYHPLNDWSPTDWATAMAGELGEALGLVKKMRRGEPVNIDDIGDELADLIIYADLLAARLGINLDASIIRKFNKVSAKTGSNQYL